MSEGIWFSPDSKDSSGSKPAWKSQSNSSEIIENNTEKSNSDIGLLSQDARRALVELVKGPYLSAKNRPNLWAEMFRDLKSIRSRLNDLFLDLVIDEELGLAYVRNADFGDPDIPKVARTQRLTMIQTAMLLALRRALVNDDPSQRVIIGFDELREELNVYRIAERQDELAFNRNVKGAWNKFINYGLLHPTTTEGRAEISPILRLLFGPEEIVALTVEYDRIAQAGEAPPDEDSFALSESMVGENNEVQP
jgi:hypothetical protein